MLNIHAANAHKQKLAKYKCRQSMCVHSFAFRNFQLVLLYAIKWMKLMAVDEIDVQRNLRAESTCCAVSCVLVKLNFGHTDSAAPLPETACAGCGVKRA